MSTEIEVFDATRMQEIEDGAIVSGEVIDDHLILTKHDGTTVDAGSVVGPPGYSGLGGAVGPKGDKGDQGDPGIPSLWVPYPVSGDYSLEIGDLGHVLEGTTDFDQTLVIPPTDDGWAVGVRVKFCQLGTGQWTVAPQVGSAVVVNGFGGLKTAGQYAEITLRKRAADEWVVSGDLVAA